jgi:hypothetical protein
MKAVTTRIKFLIESFLLPAISPGMYRRSADAGFGGVISPSLVNGSPLRQVIRAFPEEMWEMWDI